MCRGSDKFERSREIYQNIAKDRKKEKCKLMRAKGGDETWLRVRTINAECTIQDCLPTTSHHLSFVSHLKIIRFVDKSSEASRKSSRLLLKF